MGGMGCVFYFVASRSSYTKRMPKSLDEIYSQILKVNASVNLLKRQYELKHSVDSRRIYPEKTPKSLDEIYLQILKVNSSVNLLKRQYEPKIQPDKSFSYLKFFNETSFQSVEKDDIQKPNTCISVKLEVGNIIFSMHYFV